MGTNRMHNIDINLHGILHLDGRTDLRQVRCHSYRYKSLLGRWKAWAMKLHYTMWVIIAVSSMFAGALYRGQQDMMRQQARASGASMILMDLSLKELAEQRV